MSGNNTKKVNVGGQNTSQPHVVHAAARKGSVLPVGQPQPKLTPNPIAPKPSTLKKKPSSYAPKLYDPRDRLPDDEVPVSYLERRRSVVFLFFLGLCTFCLGIGLTWYGGDTNLRDFLVIGPGCLVIGFGMLAISCVFFCSDIRRKRKQGAIHQSQNQVDNTDADKPKMLLAYSPPVITGFADSDKPKDVSAYKQYDNPKPTDANHVRFLVTREPTESELYGEANHKHKSSKSTPTTSSNPQEPPKLAQPAYNAPAADVVEAAVYHVPLPAVAEDSKQEDEEIEDRSHLKVRTADSETGEALAGNANRGFNHDVPDDCDGDGSKSEIGASLTPDSNPDVSFNPYALPDEAALLRELTDVDLYGERSNTQCTVLTDVEEPAVPYTASSSKL